MICDCHTIYYKTRSFYHIQLECHIQCKSFTFFSDSILIVLHESTANDIHGRGTNDM